MNDLNENPFERQVSDVARRAVGPPREIDALGIARHAAAPTRSWSWRSTFGVLRFIAGGLVVAAFAGALLLSGVLEVNQSDEAIVGSSPSMSASPSPSTPTETAAPPAEEVTYATGTIEEKFGSHLSQDVPGSSATLSGPRWFDVQSSDPRLAGEATLLALEDVWAAGYELSVYYGRIEIRNADGAWAGTVGPLVQAMDAEAPGNELARFGPTILVGDGAYEGYTAYVHLPHRTPSPVEAQNPGWFAEGSGMEGPFEAVVVNRAVLGFPTDEQWLREMRRTGQAE